MRLSFSNIAWAREEEAEIADFLAEAGVRLVDIAPGKYFADPAAVTAVDVESVRRWWADRGFGIAGMQALLFGVSGLNLFTDDGTMLARLSRMCRLGADLGAGALTFGSPRQRDRSGLDDASAERIAVDFFRRLGDAAERTGVLVCLEPNPAMYGCNFMIRTAEAAAIVRAVDHPAIRLQLDVGAIAANGEDATRMVEEHCALIGHVHASEPGLVVLGDGGAPHVEAGAALRALRPQSIVTVEMAAPPNESHPRAVARALEVAKAAYGEPRSPTTGGDPEAGRADLVSMPRPGFVAPIAERRQGHHEREVRDRERRLAFSIVMPAYNEEATIERTIAGLVLELDREAIDYEIIVVNDASQDATLSVLQALAPRTPRLRYITNEGPKGYGHAIRAGLELYRGDAIVVVTADGSDSPRDVVAYFRAIERGADCAFGSRFAKGAKVSGYPPFKLLVNRLANGCIARLLGTRYDDYTNGFKCYRRCVVDSMQPIVSGQFNITIELSVKAIQGGWTMDVCPTDWTQREAGASSFKLFKLIVPYAATLIYCLTLNYLRGGDRRKAMGETPGKDAA